MNVPKDLRVIAVDWSGAKQGAEAKIWLAEVVAGELLRLERGYSREALAEHLIELGKGSTRLLVGIDFAFSYPAWFMEKRSLLDAFALWEMAGREGERWLRECAPPFWGMRGKTCPPDQEAYRRTDSNLRDSGFGAPKSVFQIAGAGHVGTGSIRGMPILAMLRRGGFSVWPFEQLEFPGVIEIYPRVFTGAVTKSNPQERVRYCRERYPSLPRHHCDSITASDDAFDAMVSAFEMDRLKSRLASLPTPTKQESLEGIIWRPC
jgi:hypothetical protein